MSPRPLALALACLLTLASCGSSAPAVPVALGTYVLDREASLTLSLPFWMAEVQARFDKEIDGLQPQAPRGYVLELEQKLADNLSRCPAIVTEHLRLIEFKAQIETRRRFRLDYKVPAIKAETSSAGRWQWLDDELQLIREQINDEAVDEPTMLRALYVDGAIQLQWPGLDLVFVLRRAEG